IGFQMAACGLDRFRDVERRSCLRAFIEKTARHDCQAGFLLRLVTGAGKDAGIDRDGGNCRILYDENLETITENMTVDVERSTYTVIKGLHRRPRPHLPRFRRSRPRRDTRLSDSFR